MSGSPTSKDLRDDLGLLVPLPRQVRRVVSLVPSLTESIADSGLLVAATDWCTHPPGLDVTRVRGTKNPDVPGILALSPDLVLANEEENRMADLGALRAAGVAVWVTAPQTVDEALVSLRRMLDVCGLDVPAWLTAAEEVWARPWRGDRVTAVVPIWRRPWMALGRDTFAGDVLRRLGVDHVLAHSEERYPRFEIAALRAHDLVVLPDEPYAFSADDGPEAFNSPARLVSGRHLTWYGPSLVEAWDVLTGQLYD